VRRAFAEYLHGRGIELGALNAPLDVRGVQAIDELLYVDRYKKDELLRHFPELQEVAKDIVETDITCDIVEGLKPFTDESLDFVIACHLVEHVPDPIYFLTELWRVLAVRGRLYLAVPDKECFGYDARRPLTTLEHLIEDHRKRTATVEDHHLEEFLRLSENLSIPEDPAQRAHLFEQHRARSIHIHVWNTQSFAEFLLYFNQACRPFRLLDVSVPRENERREMLFILEKAPPDALSNLLHPGWVRLAALAK
jgi:predicted SAM-dependent methyltransferase